MSKPISVRDRTDALLSEFQSILARIELCLSTIECADHQPAHSDRMIKDLLETLGNAATARSELEPLMRLFSENPSLFRQHPHGGLASAWTLRESWNTALGKLAVLSQRCTVAYDHLARQPKIPAPPLSAKEPPASDSGETNRRADDWLQAIAMVAGHLARKRLSTIARQALPATAPLSSYSLPIHQDAIVGPWQRTASAMLIRESGLFDESYYLTQLDEFIPRHIDPLTHYLSDGWKRGLDPNPLFSIRYYLSQNSDLDGDLVEPLGHYISIGSTAQKDPHPLFSTSFFAGFCDASAVRQRTWLSYFLSPEAPSVSPHPLFDTERYARDACIAETHPAYLLLHYLVKGWQHNLAFSCMFDGAYVREQLGNTMPTMEPYSLYLIAGVSRGVDPHPLFDTAFYLQQRPDAGTAADPYLHYLLIGEVAGAHPSTCFDPDYYRRRYMIGGRDMSPLEHFLTKGLSEDFDPFPTFNSRQYRDAFLPGTNAAAMPAGIMHFLSNGVLDLTAERIGRLAGHTTPAKLPEPPHAPASKVRPVVRPTATVTPEARSELKYRDYPGKAKYLPDRPNIMVVAHAAADHLFGSERSFLDMVDGLSHIPANVFVVLPRNVPDYTNALRPICQLVSTFSYGWWRDGDQPSPVAELVFKELIDSLDIDAVHCNTIMLRECMSAARSCGVASVVHVREAITLDDALVKVIGESSEAIINAVHERSDWVIGNSRLTSEMFYKPGRTLVVPNTIDLDALDIENNIDGDEVRFGLISSNIPKKGVEDVVALARLADIHCKPARFLLIGPETAIVKELQSQQAHGLLPANISFPGYAASPRDAIAQTNVVLNFSRFAESFGRTVLEAMAAKRPVIAYDWGALPELVEHGSTGYLVPYGEPERALPIIKAFCEDRNQIKLFGERACDRARAHYGLDTYRSLFRKAYTAILPPATSNTKSSEPVVKVARLEGLKTPETELRIAYFCWHFPVPSETFVLNEIEVLVRDGVDVIVFCRQSPHKTFKPAFDVKVERVDSAKTLARRLTETSRTMVHAHFTFPTVTDMVWPACEEAGIPFTFTAHAQDIFKHENDRRNRLGEIGRSPWCRAVFTLSRFHEQFIAARGFPSNKIIVNPNAVDTSRFAAATVDNREKRLKRKIIAVHRYVPKKGLSLLIRAAALIQDLDITIDLYGYGDLEAEYRALISELGLKNVVVHGAISQDEVVAVMRDADLFACPSVRTEDGDMDGIPTSIVESMAAGLPVLSTDIAGIPTVVVDGITGIVTTADPDAIAAGIRRFYDMPTAQVRSIIKAARQRVAKNHDANRLVRILRRVWMNQTIDIIIVSWNNLTELRAVVERLTQNTALPYHLIICDNQSEREPVGPFLDSLWADNPRVTVIHNNANAMVGPGTNAALAQGVSDYAIYLCGREGFSFANGWEIPFIHTFADHDRAGLVGTIGRSPTYLTGRQYPEGIRLFGDFRNQDFALKNADRIFGHIQGGLFAMRRRMYDEIGGFSDVVPHDYTDVEYSYYVESCGWELVEAPGVLALFNKSRPTLSQRFDEDVVCAHPVLLHQVTTFDLLKKGELSHCNVCDWFGKKFESADCCPGCGSNPVDRTLYRWLSEGPHMYRRLPGLAIGLDGKIRQTWREQFQGPVLSLAELKESICEKGRLSNGDGALQVGVVRLESGLSDELPLIAKELKRLFADGAELLVQDVEASDDLDDLMKLSDVLEDQGFRRLSDIEYVSRAVRFSFSPALRFQRIVQRTTSRSIA